MNLKKQSATRDNIDFRCCITCNWMHIASDPAAEIEDDCAHPDIAIRVASKDQVYASQIEETIIESKCTGWIAFVDEPIVIDAFNQVKATVRNLLDAVDVINAKSFLIRNNKIGVDNYWFGIHDRSLMEPEDRNKICVEWVDKLLELGAERVLVAKAGSVYTRTSIVIELSAANVAKLMNVICFAMTLLANDVEYTYNPHDAIFRVALTWIQ